MGLNLSAFALQTLTEAQRAILSPLQYENQTAWLEVVTPRVQAVVQADHAYSCLPTHPSLTVVGSDLDETFSQDLVAGFGQKDSDHVLAHDPMPLQMHLQRIQRGAGVYHELDLANRATIEASPSHQELFVPHGIRYAAGMSVPLSTGEAFICVGFESAAAEGYDPAVLQRLELLMPALESALRQWQRLASAREGFSTLIDRLTDPLLLFDADGREAYRNRALRDLLRDEPDASLLIQAATSLAAGTIGTDTSPPHPSQHTIDLAGGQYHLRLGHPPPTGRRDRGLLILIERTSLYPASSVLQERFGFTPRQAEVALLLARGLSNEELGQALTVSSHTARHHVQEVLKKLDVSSRAAVAHVLLHSDAG